MTAKGQSVIVDKWGEYLGQITWRCQLAFRYERRVIAAWLTDIGTEKVHVMVETKIVIKQSKPTVGKRYCRHDLMAAAGGVGGRVLPGIVDGDGRNPMSAVDRACNDDASIPAGTGATCGECD